MTTEVAVQQPSNVAALPTRQLTPSSDIFSDAANLDHANRVAKVFATSTLVPPHFQNNLANCLIALQIARRLNEDPMTVMQQLFLINGRPGWYVKYMISRVNRAGIFKGPITWHEVGEGDTLAVTAKAVLAATGEEIRASADMRMAATEGWTKNAKYRSMPAHMLRWRSAAMLINLYAPEVMLGIPAVEELETMPKMRDVTPAKTLADRLDALANIPVVGAAGEHDPDTGEITSPPPVETEDQSSPQEAPNKAPATGEAAKPKTAADYVATRRAWIEALTDADTGLSTWDAEKELRGKLKVPTEERTALQQTLKTKIALLRGARAAE
jgi:hypothetical protein